MIVDGNIVDVGYNGEVINDGLIGKGGVIGDADEGNAVMNEGDISSMTRVIRTVFTDSGIVREVVLIDLILDSCIHAVRMLFEWRREDNSCIQCNFVNVL